MIGNQAAKKHEVIEMFQNYSNCPEPTGSPTETGVNMCCCPCKTNCYPVKIDDLDLVLFDTPDLNAANCTDDDKKNIEDIQRCISKSARHVFLLVLDLGRYTTGKKELVDRITETFGEKLKENMVIVFKGDTSDDRIDVKTLKDQIKDNKDLGDLNTLMLHCSERLVTFYGDDLSAVKKIKGHINHIIIQGDEKCYTHEMMMAANKTGKCENLSLRQKIYLMIGLWLLIAVGAILFFFWKDLFEAVVSNISKSTTDRLG